MGDRPKDHLSFTDGQMEAQRGGIKCPRLLSRGTNLGLGRYKSLFSFQFPGIISSCVNWELPLQLSFFNRVETCSFQGNTSFPAKHWSYLWLLGTDLGKENSKRTEGIKLQSPFMSSRGTAVAAFSRCEATDFRAKAACAMTIKVSLSIHGHF